MEHNNMLSNERNQTKKNTTSSQISNTSVNNTSISTPNISIINQNQNKESNINQNISEEDQKEKNIHNTKDKNEKICNTSIKKKRSSIPFRRNKYYKKNKNSKTKNSNNINDNLNILNNSLDSKSSHDNKSTGRSFDNNNNNIELFRNNYINSFIQKDFKNSIEIIPFRDRKNSFTIMNTELSLDLNEDNSKLNSKRNNIRSLSKRNSNFKITNNSKLNLYSIKSFNVAKMSWSKEKKIFNKNKTIYNIKKINKTQNKLTPSKSIYYKNKKLKMHHEKFEDFKHFSPLVKNINKPKDRKTSFKNLKLSQKISPFKNKKKHLNIDIKKNIFKNIPISSEIKKENNLNKLEQLPLIHVNHKNKNDLIEKNNIINNENINNNINKIEKDKDKDKEKEELTKNNLIKMKDNSNSFQDINHSLVNNLDIPSITLNNLRISKKFQDNLEEFIDNSHCVYCLKRVIKPITLSCEHELCLSCAEEIISLYNFIHIPNIEKTFIKCPKCKKKSDIINNDLNNMLRLNWRPTQNNENTFNKKDPLSNKRVYEKKLQLCEICPSSKYIRDLAEFECLNCDIILCYECRIRHLSNPRHQDHKVIPYTKILQEKAELTLCDKHREANKLFCETCMKSICVICAQYDKEHEDHKINTIKNILDNQTIELTGNMRVCEGQIKIIEEIIGQMIYSKQKIEEEKKIFIDKANKSIDDLMNLLNNKKEELISYINNIFINKLENLENKLKNFKLVKNRYEYYRSLICDRDIDIIDRVNQIKKLNKKIFKIENLGLLNLSNFNKSFSQSLFINEPFKEVEKTLKKYAFLPINNLTIENLIKIFSTSNIIKKEYIFKDFIVILPKIKSGILLYSTLTDQINTITFHKKCDNKGPTLTIVKTIDGHIFGGYNPRSWVSESMYNECDDSFIFSLSDGKTINPIKCPLKEYKKTMAIYQNEELNSPGWGEVSEADLFISYKNLENSYSNLGRCYKAPKNVEPNCFLAGKPTHWEIDLVEVYAVEILSDDEYYKMMLN